MTEPIKRRALRVVQGDHTIYLFTLPGSDVLSIAELSRIARDDAEELIGYQRPVVRAHVSEIADYLLQESPLFPNAIVLAIDPSIKFVSSRGAGASDGSAISGTLSIPVDGESKPAWIVDGQQRAFALRQADSKLPVPIVAFAAENLEMQRDQFLRVNNTKPLPRGLVTELLPQITTPISRKLASKRLPSALVDLLNADEDSPFYQMIRRPSSPKRPVVEVPITDTPLIGSIEESLQSASGCLFPYRNLATGETDVDSVYATLLLYWNGVKTVFPEAWGLPPTKSRLMHSAGLRSMGRLMDRIMPSLDLNSPDTPALIVTEVTKVAPICRWTSGEWEDMRLKWNEVQSVSKHITALSNLLVRTYISAGREGQR